MSGSKSWVLPGVRDWIGDEERFRQQIIEIIRGVYERFGFEPLGTPAFEYQSVLFAETSNTARDIFKVEIRRLDLTEAGDKLKHNPLGLRFDHTVPLARVVSQHASRLVLPYKRYAIGPVWRAEKPQKERSREFWQADFDTVGGASLLIDAELIAVLCSVANAVGIKDYSAIFNHRVLLDGMAEVVGAKSPEQITTVIRSWDKIGKPEFMEVPEDLASVGLHAAAIEKFGETTQVLRSLRGSNQAKIRKLREIFKNRNSEEGLDQIESLLELVSAYGGEISSHLVFTPYLARGFAYYTGPVFEMVSGRSKNSFGGGGRFDRLIASLGGPDLPASGASFGLERFINVVRDVGSVNTDSTITHIYVTVVRRDEQSVRAGIELSQQMRSFGYKVELFSGEGSLKDQITSADAKGIPLVVIVGPKELASGSVTLKDMRVELTGEKDRTSNQELVSLENLREALQIKLGV